MALVDPNIAMSYRGIELPNQLAQYGQMQQIQNAQNQNRLADLQYNAAQMALQKQQAVQAYRSQNDPKSSNYYAGLRELDPMLALEEEGKQADVAKTQAEVAAKQFETQNKKLDFTLQAIGSSPTPERAISYIKKGLQDGIFSMEEASGNLAKLQNITPEDFAKYRMGQLQRTLAAKDQLEALAPQIDLQDVGGSLIALQGNRYQPGYKQPVPGFAPIPKTATIGERTAQGNLSLAQQKFQFEQANPGITVQTTEDGSLVGVNNRTGQAMPITMGGGAPAAPTGGPGMPAAPAAGTPLRGKSTTAATTEGERKAATLLQRLQFSQGQLTQALVDDPNAAKPGVFTSALDMLSTPLANKLTSEARQRVESAQLDMLDAALTLGTGAAYTKEQLEGYRKSYFPAIGDGPAQIKDKKARLENVISAAKIAAGKGAALVPNFSNAAGNDPLGLRK